MIWYDMIWYIYINKNLSNAHTTLPSHQNTSFHGLACRSTVRHFTHLSTAAAKISVSTFALAFMLVLINAGIHAGMNATFFCCCIMLVLVWDFTSPQLNSRCHVYLARHYHHHEPSMNHHHFHPTASWTAVLGLRSTQRCALLRLLSRRRAHFGKAKTTAATTGM